MMRGKGPCIYISPGKEATESVLICKWNLVKIWEKRNWKLDQTKGKKRERYEKGKAARYLNISIYVNSKAHHMS